MTYDATYNANYYQRNREKLQDYMRQRYYNKRDEILAKRAASYRKENPVVVIERKSATVPEPPSDQPQECDRCPFVAPCRAVMWMVVYNGQDYSPAPLPCWPSAELHANWLAWHRATYPGGSLRVELAGAAAPAGD